MPSWEWYFPYHHAPLLGDIAALLVGGAGAAALAAPWPTSTQPLRPYEQLMAVLPPALEPALPLPQPLSHSPDPYPKPQPGAAARLGTIGAATAVRWPHARCLVAGLGAPAG